MKKNNFWMVRAGEGGRLIEDFLSKNIVAIGWNDLGGLNNIEDLDQLKAKFREIYPEASDGQVNNNAGQIYRFLRVFKEGDHVVTYDSSGRIYSVGKITSDYRYDSNLIEYHHIRDVEWLRKVPRDDLSTTSKNSLGSTLSIFQIKDLTVKELLGKPVDKEEEIEREEETLDVIKEDMEAKALEFIKDQVFQLSWEDMEELVAGVLRGMGYKTIMTPKGSDRGKDIMASPDGLGLEDPKILVEVKHRKASMGSSDVRSFLGGLRANEKGVYVSTGGFSKEARYEADRAINPTTLVDLDMLVSLIIQHYDNFDPETRALVPLKKIYWPL
ncbi:restriction endonuclease [Flavilitoribacter nigricans]|uniref:Restriction endonuclease n=1 Tax=Flavilitoribacter nigricans (strain ATCC 23147 / DSM 23189 / NBRC 102662 / NCIMB 1420 / SS-2) TaxID=1122177 RepID=A0A2D0N7L2_FLAN2|nr:restriction endonuclease [Flavilitoribacter nigricans]PHN04370.1 restriction endonuclease [Flavilitoribacter nigricans DSM 23189 = NBRC 102662]